MTDTPTDELRLLAAKIATAYVQANPQAPDQLPGVLRIAYQGLLRCSAPLPPPEPVAKKKRRRGRPPSA